MLSASPSSRLITLTSTLIIPHITKTSSNNGLLFCVAVSACPAAGCVMEGITAKSGQGVYQLHFSSALYKHDRSMYINKRT